MNIEHLDCTGKPSFIDVYLFRSIKEIKLHYLNKEWDKPKRNLTGKWKIKYKTND